MLASPPRARSLWWWARHDRGQNGCKSAEGVVKKGNEPAVTAPKNAGEPAAGVVKNAGKPAVTAVNPKKHHFTIILRKEHTEKTYK